jgi:hypothetical protein
MDFDGQTTVYGPISGNCNFDKIDVLIFPNPSWGAFTLKIDAKKAENFILNLESLDGKSLLTENIEAKMGSNVISIENLNLNVGQYILSIKGEYNTIHQNIVIR